eukprot:sb/3473417/
MAENRLERADSFFTGTTRFKLVAEISYDDELCVQNRNRATQSAKFKLAVCSVPESSPARSLKLGEALTCFEVVDEGAGKDGVLTTTDLSWPMVNERYSCRMDTRTASFEGNYLPSRHFIGLQFKVLEHSGDNHHFAQRLKSRATTINYYKN